MKYKAIDLDFYLFALINKNEILLLYDTQIINRKNSNKKPKDGQIIDTKSWKINQTDHFLSRDELSKIWFGYQNLGF